MRDTHEDSNVGPIFQIQNDPCAFNRLPGRFQQESLLRIDVGGLSRRNPKELWIELVDSLDKPTALGYRFPSQSWLGVIESIDVPAVRRRFRDDVTAFGQQFPERFCVIDSAGKAAAESDNCDFLIFHTKC